jgi:cation diffusion facilitator CzcD-associated flavoprotein CzcO
VRLAVVGAGPAGLATLRALAAHGFDAVAFERRPCIGGVWALHDDERPTAAYRSLHLITSRDRTEYGELPMPEGTPDYPSRDAVGRYLEGYAAQFGLLERIRLGDGVATARRTDGGWELELESGARERFDMLVVANGHNEEAKWPEPPYPGEFEGRQLHALDYAEADEFRGQNVLVVGMGNSAMDIATDISLVADRTYLSARHGTWVIPKRLLGQPADQIIKPWVAVHVPWRIRQPLSEFLLRLTVGPPERYGLPEPSRGLFQDHPTITDTVLSRISHGELTPKPGIATLAPGAVSFTDGSEEPVDAIVWCTGYRVSMPFLDEALTGPDPKELPLYKRIFHLDCPDLFFVGLMQSTGSAFPIVERQAQILAQYLAGEWALPSATEQRRDCERKRGYALARWGEHGRPAMRVDFDRFMHELGRELERGRARAAA